MPVVRYLYEFLAFRIRAADVAARIDGGALTPLQQQHAVQALLAGSEARVGVVAIPQGVLAA